MSAYPGKTSSTTIDPDRHPHVLSVADRKRVRSRAVIVCAPDRGDPLRQVGGITLIERLFRQFSELQDVASIVVLTPPGVAQSNPSRRVSKSVSFLETSGSDGWEMLRSAAPHLEGRLLVVASDLVIDQRLLEMLTTCDRDLLLASRAGVLPELAGRLRSESVHRISLAQPEILVLAATAIPSYWESMHGEVPMHLMRVTNQSEADGAWAVLLDHIQRRTQELPSRYFDIRFENLLVRWLAPTSISANQVTMVTTLLGFAVAGLYLEGWLRLGVLLAIFVEVLDGVDGKLARITRTTSKLGEYEHIGDFFYENSWYLALGAFLSRSGHPYAWGAALAMVAFDLTDNLAYAVLDVKWGRSLDNVNGFLQRFRLIAGRRNIYTWMFLPGFLLGAASFAFYAAVVWAGITAIVHAILASLEAMRLIRSSSQAPSAAAHGE